MAYAKQETCPHPRKQRERLAYGRYRCARCDVNLTPSGRCFEVRHSERVVLTFGDRIAVNSQYHGGAFQGIFLWSEDYPSGRAYTIAEVQMWKHEGRMREDWAALRVVRPEYVRQAPGVRDRKKREETAS